MYRPQWDMPPGIHFMIYLFLIFFIWFCLSLYQFFFLQFYKITLRQNIQLQLEIDTIGKWSIPVICIDAISTASCAVVFYKQVVLVITPPWGKLLQFSWVKLLHCNCHTSWGIRCTKCNYFHQVLLRNTPYLCIFTRQRSSNGFFHDSGWGQCIYIIFIILRLTHKRRNNTQETQWHTHTPT